MNRFTSLGCLLFSALSILTPVHADTFPNKPVTLMVPYPPGGLSDVIARKVNQALAQ
jgi:tripartite-type tricarboxylate transporter receptor subunit TctC